MLRNTLRTMGVPKMPQLRKGLGVNVVLKADQRTGKLTTGNIADILTRGDHPRGIKVRLSDGQIGRVQSLARLNDVSGEQGFPWNASDGEQQNSNRPHLNSRHPLVGQRRRDGHGLQEDHRLDRPPQESLSLFDYVRIPPSTERTSTSQSAEITSQEQLESEFPKFDSALISAILVDYPKIAEARAVLSSLS
jgi:uncharacterized repeat protein (TIGR03833 family)